MPNRLMLEVGPEQIVLPLKGTVAQIRAAIRRYALRNHIGVEGRTAEDIGKDVLASFKKLLIENSMDAHRAEKLAALNAAIEEEISAENDL